MNEELDEILRKGTTVSLSAKGKGAKPFDYIVLDQVSPEDSRWLWYPYIPANKLTIIEGDPGVGKTWITSAIAAAISSGARLPSQKLALPPQKVIMASTEDGLTETMVPRLMQLGADMRNIAMIPHIFTLDTEGVKRLKETIRGFAATIVFIDPIVAYLGGGLDMNKANETRSVLAPLARIAEETQSAVVAVRHLRKEGARKGKAIYAGIGSIDFTAAARSVLLVEETKGTKVMRHIKANNAPKGPTMAYEFNFDVEPVQKIEPGGNVIVVETKWDQANFRWIGLYEEPLPKPKINREPKKQELAVAFIRDALRSGPKPAADIMAWGKAKGYSYQTMERAKRRVAVSYKDATGWHWKLAGTPGKDYIPSGDEFVPPEEPTWGDPPPKPLSKGPRRSTTRPPLSPKLAELVKTIKAKHE